MSSWNEWSQHVLIELERMDVNIKELDKRLDELSISTTKSDTQKEAEIKQLKQEIISQAAQIKQLQEDMAEYKTTTARLGGQMNVWTKVWLSVLTVIVLGTAAAVAKAYINDHFADKNNPPIEKTIEKTIKK